MGNMQKKPLVIGNWKMHKTQAEAKQFFEILLKSRLDTPVGFAVPFTLLPIVSKYARHNLEIGAQNIHHEKQGAFTGEISAAMALDAGASFTLIGHSERRKLFFETDEIMQKKIQTALDAGLHVILCVGETLEDRDNGQTAAVLKRQLQSALVGINPEKILYAYEPVWAIGTGQVASPAMIAEAHSMIRELIGHHVKILYGGSVNGNNAAEILAIAGVDGLLVGGAALQAHTFLEILDHCSLN